MKKSTIIISICAVTISAIMGLSAFAAADTANSTDTDQPAVTNSTADSTQPTVEDFTGRHGRYALTEEQKTEMEAKRVQMEAMTEKWSALTDAQKEEIYALKEKASRINSQIIDKYLEWGLMDQNTADEMKAGLTESITRMRENGKMPFMRGQGGFGKDRHGKFGCKHVPSTEDTSSDPQTNGN